jgi:hypothetical protein
MSAQSITPTSSGRRDHLICLTWNASVRLTPPEDSERHGEPAGPLHSPRDGHSLQRLAKTPVTDL